jgi:hypothetical protein
MKLVISEVISGDLNVNLNFKLHFPIVVILPSWEIFVTS